MLLEFISLINFKNYEESKLHFSANLNCFLGQNGSGKTNLLDAIHYLALCKSATNYSDIQLIKHEESYFMLKAGFEHEGEKHVVEAAIVSRKSKTFKYDSVPYEKLSEHIGKIPLVMVAPNDIDLIREGSEVRRKFIDGILAQVDAQYLTQLLEYNKYLKSRNALLKHFYETRSFDKDLLETYDEKLLPLNHKIHKSRLVMMEEFIPTFNELYEFISESKETVGLEYKSGVLEADFDQEFAKSLQHDLNSQRTNKGIHKDDFKFTIGGYELKKFGSQGQQKSFVLALQLAKQRFLESKKGFKPILLLDDIFDKLDDNRIKKLLSLIGDGSLGQVFLTDANPKRAEEHIKSVPSEVCIFKVEKGTAIKNG
jgi:DNA replication and repair protein RecF